MNFTRREKRILLFLLVLFPLFFFVDQQTLDEWALFGMLFIVLPLGVYIVADPERSERKVVGE